MRKRPISSLILKFKVNNVNNYLCNRVQVHIVYGLIHKNNLVQEMTQ